MRKVSYFLLLVVIATFVGCNSYDEKYECFPDVRINYMTRSDVDSVHIYLNGSRVCYEKSVMVDGRCENCPEAKGGFGDEQILCKTSKDEGFVFLSREKNNLERCVQSESLDIWVVYECELNENSYGKSLDLLLLSLIIFSQKEEKTVQVSADLHSGNHYNIMLEQDTIKWYGYTHDSMRDYFDYYGPPEAWQRMGCSEGYCVASLPMVDKEVCYEK